MEVCEIARALYAFDSNTGMKFDAGQLLNVFEKGEDGWWWGEVQNSEIEGWFPATYVSTLEQVFGPFKKGVSMFLSGITLAQYSLCVFPY